MLRGFIFYWFGPTEDIPYGWQLCDGTNGTPDLRDRFIIGAGGTLAVGSTGGAASHTHTFTSNQHSHTAKFGTGVTGTGAAFNFNSNTNAATGTTDTGGYRPPFYALLPIMQL